MRWFLLPLSLVLIATASPIQAQDPPQIPCPPVPPGAQPGCKILILNAAEEQVLVGQNMILDTAKQGRALDLGNAADYIRKRIETAPQGKILEPSPGSSGGAKKE